MSFSTPKIIISHINEIVESKSQRTLPTYDKTHLFPPIKSSFHSKQNLLPKNEDEKLELLSKKSNMLAENAKKPISTQIKKRIWAPKVIKRDLKPINLKNFELFYKNEDDKKHFSLPALPKPRVSIVLRSSGFVKNYFSLFEFLYL